MAKHKALSDSYWTNQMDLWKAGISYGECDSHEYDHSWKQKLNGTGHNSTCYFNIMRGINMTREVLRTHEGKIKEPKLRDYSKKEILDLVGKKYLGSHLE